MLLWKQSAKSRRKILKLKKLFSDLLHLLIHNSFPATVLVMGLVHFALLLITLAAGAVPLTIINSISVITYIVCFLFCRVDYILPVYWLILIEVTVYAVLSTYYIGYGGGSHFFLFSIVPIIIYFGLFLFKKRRLWIVGFSLFADFLVFALSYIFFYGRDPVIRISDKASMILTIFSAFAMFFSMVFYNIIYIYRSRREVLDLEKENEQLSADANNDTLTELLNRRGFLPLLEELMKEGEEHHFCIAFLDIDNFKKVNDTFGHDCGDEVLRHISRLIRKELHGCEVCRWGGEEIIILLKDTNLRNARMLMETVRGSVEATPTVFFNKRVPVTITIGLVENTDAFKKPNDIIQAADKRMYYGKQHGKNILISRDIK